MSTEAGWNNKKHMTAADYRQWCDMVRRLIGIYERDFPTQPCVGCAAKQDLIDAYRNAIGNEQEP